MKYNITRNYIDKGNSRSGEEIKDVKFIVSHDTGNPGATAYDNRSYFQNVQPSASAHTFIDDNTILEIIPLDEKAWHVRYNVDTDDKRFGEDANDAAIGVELAYGGNINFDEAYKRYVWYHAYLLDKYNLDADTDIVAHSTLDPTRRIDPQNVLNKHGISWEDFIRDVKEVYRKNFAGGSSTLEPQVKGASVTLPLTIGDRGDFVRDVQQNLVDAGYPLPKYGVDGIYGTETQGAVKAFQADHGLRTTGKVDADTLDKLMEKTNTSTADVDLPLPNGILSIGDKGPKVMQVQKALKAANFDPKYIDGIYGPLTKDAVYRFQSMYKELKNDGIYGPNTKAKLEEVLSHS